MKEEYVLFDDITTIALMKFIRNSIDADFKIRHLASTNILEDIELKTVGVEEINQKNVQQAIDDLYSGKIPTIQILYKGEKVAEYKSNVTFKIYEKVNGEFLFNQNQQISRIKKHI